MAFNYVSGFFLYFFYGNPYQHPTVTRGQWRFAMLSPRGCCASFANPKMPIVHRWSCRPAWCWDIADTQCHQRSMENHHFSWENSLFLWSFSIATLNYQRVCCGNLTFLRSFVSETRTPEVVPPVAVVLCQAAGRISYLRRQRNGSCLLSVQGGDK